MIEIKKNDGTVLYQSNVNTIKLAVEEAIDKKIATWLNHFYFSYI